MTGRKYEDKLWIDMPFDEALERFAEVDPEEMRENIRKAGKKKPPGRDKPPEGSGQNRTVVRLRDRRKRNHV